MPLIVLEGKLLVNYRAELNKLRDQLKEAKDRRDSLEEELCEAIGEIEDAESRINKILDLVNPTDLSDALPTGPWQQGYHLTDLTADVMGTQVEIDVHRIILEAPDDEVLKEWPYAPSLGEVLEFFAERGGT